MPNEALRAAQPRTIPPEALADRWDDNTWNGLLLAIKFKNCTPFLGAGACAGVLPLGRDIAAKWALEYGYPFSVSDGLPRIAQYMAIKSAPDTPKFEIRREFAGKGPPDFTDPNEPHRVVADLELPIYITTNYDDFMTQALRRADPLRVPKQLVCRWDLAGKRNRADFDPGFVPTPQNPIVFHLHGRLSDQLADQSSMVLTEDDYLEFLVSVSRDKAIIPPCIEAAFASSTLIFMGYSLEDINFRVIFRKLANYLQRSQSERHVSVQIAPKPDESTEEMIKRANAQKDYLEKQYGLQKVKVYWGTCKEFAADLRARWEAFNAGP